MTIFRKPRRHVARVFIHCSADDSPRNDNAKTIDRWHRERGWSGIGYHYFIRKDGTLEAGRSLEKTPAAQGGKSKKPGSVKGGNAGTIAICLHGLEESKFTQAQFNTLIELCRQINEAYDGKVTFHGHREVAFKACPVFDYKRVLGLDEKGRLFAGEETIAMDDDPNDLQLRKGMRGSLVKDLQAILNDLNYSVGREDGIFGGRTRRGVLDLQAENDMDITGAISINEARTADPPELDEARTEATTADVIANSRTARAAKTAQDGAIIKAGAGTATAALASTMESPSAAVDKASKALDTVESGKAVVERSKDVVEQFTGGIIDFRMLIIIMAALGVAYALWSAWNSRKALQQRVQDYRSGKNL